MTQSSPPGMGTFHNDLNALLADWKEVELGKFYYEDASAVSKGMPWQEGRLRDTQVGKSASWRYYHCAGLRIRWDGEAARYFLPAVAVQE